MSFTYKLSTVSLLDKRQPFKSCQSNDIYTGLELSSSNAEKTFVGNFKIAYYFFKFWVTMFSAGWSDGFWIVSKQA